MNKSDEEGKRHLEEEEKEKNEERGEEKNENKEGNENEDEEKREVKLDPSLQKGRLFNMNDYSSSRSIHSTVVPKLSQKSLNTASPMVRSRRWIFARSTPPKSQTFIGASSRSFDSTRTGIHSVASTHANIVEEVHASVAIGEIGSNNNMSSLPEAYVITESDMGLESNGNPQWTSVSQWTDLSYIPEAEARPSLNACEYMLLCLRTPIVRKFPSITYGFILMFSIFCGIGMGGIAFVFNIYSSPDVNNTDRITDLITKFPTSPPVPAILDPNAKTEEIKLMNHLNATVAPSMTESVEPSVIPSPNPSVRRSSIPSTYPSYSPSFSPSLPPSMIPSPQPSSRPSETPSLSPTSNPSSEPSQVPSSSFTFHPSSQPSQTPSSSPTLPFTAYPSAYPSSNPSKIPSSSPTEFPGFYPTSLPSFLPTLVRFKKIGNDIEGYNDFEYLGQVDLNHDGNILAATGNKKLQIFTWIESTEEWELAEDLSKHFQGDGLRSSILLSSSGNSVIVGDYSGKGEVMIFQNLFWRGPETNSMIDLGHSWAKVGDTLYGEDNNDSFGIAVGISDDAQRIVVGALGYVKVFDLVYNRLIFGDDEGLRKRYTWEMQEKFKPGGKDKNGLLVKSLSLSGDGQKLLVTRDNSQKNKGVVVIYDLDRLKEWGEIELDSQAEHFGSTISLSNDGNRFAVVADDGVVKLFDYAIDEDYWYQIGGDITVAGNATCFGCSMSISAAGDRVVIGGGAYAMVHIYEVNKTSWKQTLVIDYDSWSLVISGDGKRIAAGSPWISKQDSISVGQIRVWEYLI